MKVAELWRYPVKSMAGETLDRAHVGSLGIMGDRVVHIEDAAGHLITARTHPDLLGHHASLDSSGEPLVDGEYWTGPGVKQKVADIVGPDAQLIWDESEARFDVLPLLIATDGAISAFGHDRKRLRPNIVVSGVEGLAERAWPGRVLRIGKVVIGVKSLRGRCVMTTFDPDSLEQDFNVLRGIFRKFDGRLALNAYVIQAGEIQVGDPVEVVSIKHDTPVGARN